MQIRQYIAFARLGILSNIEYRVNYITDALVQPIVSACIEAFLWSSLFLFTGKSEIAGFGMNDYLSYVIWGAFFARVSSNWMYEFRMIEEIDTGSINALLGRPISFFNYYLYQFLGYKAITMAISFSVPLAISYFAKWPLLLDRLPLVLLLAIYYLFLLHILSFLVAILAFHFNRIYSLTTTKNLALWLLSGELVPLDLLPQGLKSVMLILPFSSGVYVPVAYLIGRVDVSVVIQGFISITVSIVLFGLLAIWAWKKSLQSYTGTGA